MPEILVFSPQHPIILVVSLLSQVKYVAPQLTWRDITLTSMDHNLTLNAIAVTELLHLWMTSITTPYSPMIRINCPIPAWAVP